MAETLSVRLASLVDITTLRLYLHDHTTGSLLNVGGDLLTHIAGGLFTTTLDESRAGLGHLSANVCDGAENPVNLVWEGWLQEGQTEVVSDYPAYDAMFDPISEGVADTQAYLEEVIVPKLDAITVNTDMIPALEGGDPQEVALAMLLLDWTTIVNPVPARSALNAFRHIRNRWAIVGTEKTVYAEDNTTPAFTSEITGGPDGEITADYPNT